MYDTLQGGFHPFYRPRRPLGWVEVYLYPFLGPSALDGGGGSAPRPGRLYPRERPGTHCTGGWVGPRAGLDGPKISSQPGFDPRTVQPVVSRYTDWATRPTTRFNVKFVLFLAKSASFCYNVKIYNADEKFLLESKNALLK